MKYDNKKPELLEDEPWFLIRGRDIFAVDAIRAYADLTAKASSTHAEDQERSNNLMKHALQILKIAEHIDNWQDANKDKVREPKPEPKKAKMLTPDQISKLPPELQRAAELRKRISDGERFISIQQPDDSHNLTLALTYCLRMQEERDQIKNHRSIAQAELRTAEATIATLTRELENSRINHIDANQRNITAEAEVTRLREHMSACENCAALSHTPEGKI